MVWIYDDNNTENNRILVGSVDETYNQLSYQCVILIFPIYYSTFGTLTVAGEIFHICTYVHKYLFAYCLLA